MLSRPSDNGHTPFGDIYISFSLDMKYWGEHRNVMKVAPFQDSAWQCTKIGAGTVPFLTKEGWLMFYHGVINTCNGFVIPWELQFWIRIILRKYYTAVKITSWLRLQAMNWQEMYQM